MVDASIIKTYEGTFEIVSLAGTLEKDNSHLHISIADKDGNTFGGHLKNESVVGITAEIVIVKLDKISFIGQFDKNTGYNELVIDNF